MGGRIATQVAAADHDLPAAGLVLLGYPLHPPGRSSELRAAHLPAIARPMLFVQGSRDTFRHAVRAETDARRPRSRADSSRRRRWRSLAEGVPRSASAGGGVRRRAAHDRSVDGVGHRASRRRRPRIQSVGLTSIRRSRPRQTEPSSTVSKLQRTVCLSALRESADPDRQQLPTLWRCSMRTRMSAVVVAVSVLVTLRRSPVAAAVSLREPSRMRPAALLPGVTVTLSGVERSHHAHRRSRRIHVHEPPPGRVRASRGAARVYNALPRKRR